VRSDCKPKACGEKLSHSTSKAAKLINELINYNLFKDTFSFLDYTASTCRTINEYFKIEYWNGKVWNEGLVSRNAPTLAVRDWLETYKQDGSLENIK